MKKYATIFLIFIASGWVQAQTQYVSDHLVITLRTGQGAQFQIIKTLSSGEHVKVLEVTDTGYTHVETVDGVQGWVRSQYLIDEPTAQEKLANTQVVLEKTRTRLESLKTNFKSLKEERDEFSVKIKQLTEANTRMENELKVLNEVAKNPIMLDKANREFRQKNVSLEKDLQRLNQENHSLKDRSNREWFVIGALVLFIGVILGLVIPKLRMRQRNAW